MVKCADCGFLTMRNMFTGNLEEVGTNFRETGQPRMIRVSDNPTTGIPHDTTPFRHVPICFVRAADLRAEALQDGTGAGNQDIPPPMVLQAISADRVRPNEGSNFGFTPWVQGFTPKEHRELLDRNQLLAEQWRRQDADLSWRSAQEQARMDWEAGRDHDNRNWQIAQTREARKWRWTEAGIFALISGMFIIAGALVGRGL